MLKKKTAQLNAYAGKSKTTSGESVRERRKNIGSHLGFGAVEAYKLLRTNLTFSLADESKCRVIGVTSALRGEGKSITCINLAYTLAQNGKKVLLMEADMRIPVVAKTLRLGDGPGLSNVLAGIGNLSDAVRNSPLIRTMFVLPAGEIPPNPAEILSSRRMERVMEALTANFEYIIVDLPPIGIVSDGLTISKLLTGMIMVVRQDYCTQSALSEAMGRLELLKVKVLGFVFNSADTAEKRYMKYGSKYGKSVRYSRGYGYGYGYGYGTKPAETGSRSGAGEQKAADGGAASGADSRREGAAADSGKAAGSDTAAGKSGDV